MAHECPECGMVCYCNGDIDDLVLNCKEDIVACRHCDKDEVLREEP